MVLTVLSFGIDTNRAIRLVSSFLLAVVPLAMRVER
jgi:hypothetical protein